jgi:hypothetical protein
VSYHRYLPGERAVASTIVLQLYDTNWRPQLSGYSDVKDHNDWLELISFAFIDDPGPRSLTFIFADVFTVGADILQACASGKKFGKATLKCFRADGLTYKRFLQLDFWKPSLTTVIPSGSNLSAAFHFAEVVNTYQSPAQEANEELEGSGPDGWSYNNC